MSDLSYMDKLLDGVEVKKLTLGDIGEFIRGNGIQKKDLVEAGFPAVHYGQIFTRYGFSAVQAFTFISDELAKKSRIAQKSDLLIATTSENDEDVLKSIAWLGEKVAISGDMMLFRHGQNVKYLAYYFQTDDFQKQKIKFITGAKVRRVSRDSLSKMTVSLPSLEVQAEIVRVLDAFTELTAELTAQLTAELVARKQQYTYYRDQLLTFEESKVEWKKLEDVCEKISSGKNKFKSELGLYPVFGSTGIIGRTDAKVYSKEQILVARVGANAGRVNIAKGEYDVSDNTLIVQNKDNIILKFLYYYLVNVNLNRFTKGAGQPLLTAGQLKTMLIPLPPLAEQQRIVAILDKFDALTTSLTEGLPREIELRQQQYEYYRELLLSFPKAEVAKHD
ncbi:MULTISPECIES: restriction endonuclease subunit S [unclassified Psychrobacter]|uniref:restriction endonuclease subunit S n=1 Tax=unclassified Psychrobacter TaxID=196806 RepID=UPI0025D0E708|nr:MULTISPECIES: restriction endonuclease subunit S [unclassified Psychrobacter]